MDGAACGWVAPKRSGMRRRSFEEDGSSHSKIGISRFSVANTNPHEAHLCVKGRTMFDCVEHLVGFLQSGHCRVQLPLPQVGCHVHGRPLSPYFLSMNASQRYVSS